MISVALLAAAAAVLFWPMKPKPVATLSIPTDLPPPPKPSPTYQSAIADLARVRLRLLQTDALDDKTKAAIDTLTLALVGGSDK